MPAARSTALVLMCSVILVSVTAAPAADAGFTLVDSGQPRATIVIADNPAPCSQEAATVLQATLSQMSGATLPIIKAGAFTGDSPAVLVGMSELSKKAGVDITQDEDAGEHYVISVSADRILLVGNDAGQLRGSAFAAYDLLQRIGCGWYGPDPDWQVIPKRDTAIVPAMNVDEKPAFAFRQICAVGAVGKPLTDAWRLGGKYVAQSHAFDYIIPREKFAEQHPDWFGPKQPCLTHPDVIELVTKQFRQRLDSEKGIVTFSLSANDALGFCDCPRCRAVGNASALNLYFANAIARNLNKTHPGRFLLTFYGFWATHDAPFPMLKAEPGVCMMLVNEGNHTHPVDEPERPRHLPDHRPQQHPRTDCPRWLEENRRDPRYLRMVDSHLQPPRLEMVTLVWRRYFAAQPAFLAS